MASATFVANFARQAVIVRVANFGANIVIASFANGARQIVRARHVALIGDAHVAAGTLIRCNACGWNSDAALFWRWISFEADRTLARCHMIFQFAQRVRTANIFIARVLAIVVVARLVWPTIAIAAATDDACALLARLTHRTLAMTQTFDKTFVVLAVLAVGAIVLIATGDGALATVANAGFAFEIAGACKRVANASVFGEIRNEFEFTGARANCFAIFDRALHIRTAQFVAFVDTMAANAASACRTFVVADTLTDRMASSRFGESSVARWTFASVTGAGWTEFAHSRFGAMTACVGQLASGIWNRIAAIAWRALAHWRLIFGDANGIFAARQFVAHVVAGVCESIA